jgi:hypothetical protein
LCTGCEYSGAETKQAGTRTLQQCQDPCIADSGCLAIDYGKDGRAGDCYQNPAGDGLAGTAHVTNAKVTFDSYARYKNGIRQKSPVAEAYCGPLHGGILCSSPLHPSCNETSGICGFSQATIPFPDYITTADQTKEMPVINVPLYSKIGMLAQPHQTPKHDDDRWFPRDWPFTFKTTIIPSHDPKPGEGTSCDSGAAAANTANHPFKCWFMIAGTSWSGCGGCATFQLMLRRYDNVNTVVLHSEDIQLARRAGLCKGFISTGTQDVPGYDYNTGVPIDSIIPSPVSANVPTTIVVSRTVTGLYTFEINGTVTGSCQTPGMKRNGPTAVYWSDDCIPNPPIYYPPADPVCAPPVLVDMKPHNDQARFRIGSTQSDVMFPFRGIIQNTSIVTGVPIPGVTPSSFDYVPPPRRPPRISAHWTYQLSASSLPGGLICQV